PSEGAVSRNRDFISEGKTVALVQGRGGGVWRPGIREGRQQLPLTGLTGFGGRAKVIRTVVEKLPGELIGKRPSAVVEAQPIVFPALVGQVLLEGHAGLVPHARRKLDQPLVRIVPRAQLQGSAREFGRLVG